MVHAPYPGKLKFQGVPSSMFAAAGPFVVGNPERTVAYLDPRGPNEGFYSQLRAILATGAVRALCVSTSTAAIEETARIAALASELCPESLVLVGGPHEDAVDHKAAHRLPGVHMSLAGEAESPFKWILEAFLERDEAAITFVEALSPSSVLAARLPGRFTVTSCSWQAPLEIDGGPNCYADPRPLVFPESYPTFDVFPSGRTIPLMVSRGCSYGKCTFCSESNRDGGVTLTKSFDWVEELAARTPEAALYFQDSIFPGGNRTSNALMPLLQRLGRTWGCQVYLPTLTRRRVEELADHGCNYIYTGLESGSEQVLRGIHKSAVTRDLVLERMEWARVAGLRVGVSLMFGALSVRGELLESVDSITATEELVEDVVATGVDVAGIYPNVQTVLPGTDLARGLGSNGHELDFYRMPRAPVFDGLEDGGVGYNFLTLAESSERRVDLALRIAASARRMQSLYNCPWHRARRDGAVGAESGVLTTSCSQ